MAIIIKVIEFTALIVALVFGVLWVLRPNGPYEPIIAVSSLVFVGTELYRRYGAKKETVSESKSHAILDIDYKNTIAARFTQESNKKTGNICLLFYVINVVNDSEKPFTVKSVSFRYLHGAEVKEVDSHVVLTGTVYAPLDKENKNALIIYRHSADNAVLMGWDNLRTAIGKRRVIPPGGVLSGSAVYVLDIKDPEELASIQKTEIVVSDFAGGESVHKVELPENIVLYAKQSEINPSKFYFDEAGKFHPA